LTTGVATVVGNTGLQAGSLQFGPDGLLYAGTTSQATGGNLFRINKSTGHATLVGPTGFDSVTGLTVAPMLLLNQQELPVLSWYGSWLVIVSLLIVAARSVSPHGLRRLS
jgi:hypothetical protein